MAMNLNKFVNKYSYNSFYNCKMLTDDQILSQLDNIFANDDEFQENVDFENEIDPFEGKLY